MENSLPIRELKKLKTKTTKERTIEIEINNTIVEM